MVRRRHAVAAGENERNSGRDRDERRKQHKGLVHARTSLMSRREDGAPAGGLDRPGAPFPVGGGTEQPPDAIRVGPQSLMSLKSSRLRPWMVNPDRRVLTKTLNNSRGLSVSVTSPAQVGHIRLGPPIVPNSGKPEFGWGEVKRSPT